MTQEDTSSARTQPAIPLAYEPPASKESGGGRLVALVFIVLFICGTAVGIFAIQAELIRPAMYNSGRAMPDSWPAALAVLALAAMGTSFGYFLTRRR